MQSIIDYYEMYCGIMPRAAYSDIQFYLEKGLSEQEIIEAIATTSANGKRHWGYTKAVLQSKLLAKDKKTLHYIIEGEPW